VAESGIKNAAAIYVDLSDVNFTHSDVFVISVKKLPAFLFRDRKATKARGIAEASFSGAKVTDSH
jgi:hypothetical protein